MTSGRLRGEDDQRSRVGVEEIPAADRRQLAVAEESGQRERAKVLANQPDVVVRDAVESAPAPGAIEIAAEGRTPSAEGARHAGQRDLEIVARRFGVAKLELDGLADAHGVAHGQSAGGLVGADEIADEEIAALER